MTHQDGIAAVWYSLWKGMSEKNAWCQESYNKNRSLSLLTFLRQANNLRHDIGVRLLFFLKTHSAIMSQVIWLQAKSKQWTSSMHVADNLN